MNPVIHRISLDIHHIHSQTALPVRRWDTGRQIAVTLTENGAPYHITDGCTAELVCLRPDGSILKNSCAIESDVILCDLTMRTTVQTGQLECEIRLLDASGMLITSPRFLLTVYATIYDYGDAVESEIAAANTVKSANPGYSEVLMWSDGNPEGEDRVGYFVAPDTARSAAMMKKAVSSDQVCGVSVSAPGFAANAPGGRYDDGGNLLPQYCYVGMLGFLPVIDKGTCAANSRCRPGEDGTAVPDDTQDGFLVVERLDENRVLIRLDQRLDPASLKKDFVSKSGDSMTGHLSLPDPTEAAHGANKAYVDGKRKLFQASIPSEGWAGDLPPYTQTVGVTGLRESDAPHITAVYGDDLETALSQKDAWAMVSRAKAGENSVVFTCLEEKPTVEIPIQVEVLG